MVSYAYRCPTHGEQIVNKPMAEASREERCWECMQFGRDLEQDFAPMKRVYTTPIIDCHSYGRNMAPARTPTWRRKTYNEDDARRVREIAREEGRQVQFGAGRTTGT